RRRSVAVSCGSTTADGTTCAARAVSPSGTPTPRDTRRRSALPRALTRSCTAPRGGPPGIADAVGERDPEILGGVVVTSKRLIVAVNPTASFGRRRGVGDEVTTRLRDAGHEVVELLERDYASLV